MLNHIMHNISSVSTIAAIGRVVITCNRTPSLLFLNILRQLLTFIKIYRLTCSFALPWTGIHFPIRFDIPKRMYRIRVVVNRIWWHDMKVLA